MKAIWNIVDRCILAIMTYAGDAMDLSKKEMETMESILTSLLKRIVGAPGTTSNTAILVETGFLPIEYA